MGILNKANIRRRLLAIVEESGRSGTITQLDMGAITAWLERHLEARLESLVHLHPSKFRTLRP